MHPMAIRPLDMCAKPRLDIPQSTWHHEVAWRRIGCEKSKRREDLQGVCQDVLTLSSIWPFDQYDEVPLEADKQEQMSHDLIPSRTISHEYAF